MTPVPLLLFPAARLEPLTDRRFVFDLGCPPSSSPVVSPPLVVAMAAVTNESNDRDTPMVLLPEGDFSSITPNTSRNFLQLLLHTAADAPFMQKTKQ